MEADCTQIYSTIAWLHANWTPILCHQINCDSFFMSAYVFDMSKKKTTYSAFIENKISHLNNENDKLFLINLAYYSVFIFCSNETCKPCFFPIWLKSDLYLRYWMEDLISPPPHYWSYSSELCVNFVFAYYVMIPTNLIMYRISRNISEELILTLLARLFNWLKLCIANKTSLLEIM